MSHHASAIVDTRLTVYKLKGPDFYDSVQVVIKLKFTAVMIFKQTGCHLSEPTKANNDCVLFIGRPVDPSKLFTTSLYYYAPLHDEVQIVIYLPIQ